MFGTESWKIEGGEVHSTRTLDWDLIRAAFTGDVIHWLEGFVLFESWRIGRQEETSYPKQFGTIASRATGLLSKDLKLQGGSINRTGRKKPTWKLSWGREPIVRSNILDAVELYRRAAAAFHNDDPAAWGLLRGAYAEWPDAAPLTRAMAGLSTCVSGGDVDAEWLESVCKCLDARKLALLGAVIKVTLLARARRLGVVPEVAEPFLRRWYSDLVMISDALDLLEKRWKPEEGRTDSVSEFAKLATRYINANAGLRDGYSQTDPHDQSARRERDECLDGVLGSAMVSDARSVLTSAFPALDKPQIDECTRCAIYDFLAELSAPVRPTAVLFGQLCRHLRRVAKSIWSTQQLAVVCECDSALLGKIKDELQSTLGVFEKTRLDDLIIKITGTIPELLEEQWRCARADADDDRTRVRKPSCVASDSRGILSEKRSLPSSGEVEVGSQPPAPSVPSRLGAVTMMAAGKASPCADEKQRAPATGRRGPGPIKVTIIVMVAAVAACWIALQPLDHIQGTQSAAFRLSLLGVIALLWAACWFFWIRRNWQVAGWGLLVLPIVAASFNLSLYSFGHLSIRKPALELPIKTGGLDVVRGQNEQRAQESFQRGVGHEEGGELHKAAWEYHDAIASKPDFWQAYYKLAGVERRLGDLAQAIETVRRAIAIEPQKGELHYNLCALLFEAGRPLEATRACERAAQLGPNDYVSLYNYGESLAKVGKLADAARQFRRVLEINPSFVPALINLGNCLYSTGDIHSGLSEFRKAIELDPRSTEAHENIAMGLFTIGELEGAIKEFQKVLELDPESASAHFGLGCVYSKLGRDEEAIAEYRKAIALNPEHAEAHHNLGAKLADKGDIAGVLVSYRRAVELQPDDPSNRCSLARAYLLSGDPIAAIDDVNRVLGTHPSDTRARTIHACARIELGEADKGIEELRETISSDPDWHSAFLDIVRGWVALVMAVLKVQ